MRLWVDTADVEQIAAWADDDRISGFTTNPTLMREKVWASTQAWAEAAIHAAAGKPISIDGPDSVWELGPNVWRKVVLSPEAMESSADWGPTNWTAVFTPDQFRSDWSLPAHDIVSVFAGRIMDTGRKPGSIIKRAKRTRAQVLWASVREPYNIVQAEAAGCDIVTVPPAILRKYLDWQGLPLETVAARTIAQFDKDREGLWS
jgi:transaldolase